MDQRNFRFQSSRLIKESSTKFQNSLLKSNLKQSFASRVRLKNPGLDTHTFIRRDLITRAVITEEFSADRPMRGIAT